MLANKIIVFILLTLIISSIVKYFIDYLNQIKITNLITDSYIYLYIIILSTILINFIIFNQIFYKHKKIEKDFSIVHPASL